MAITCRSSTLAIRLAGLKSQRIIRFWLATGIDGMVIDAVNWYIDCTWDICRYIMTDVIQRPNNQFCQPEGAGGFNDDPVCGSTQGGWNCIMDYAIKLWWEGIDVIRDAVSAGDPRPMEAPCALIATGSWQRAGFAISIHLTWMICPWKRGCWGPP